MEEINGTAPTPTKPCRNAAPITSEHRGVMLVCPCSPAADGTCACTAERTIGAERNLCGCWPEPPAPPAPRRDRCRCGERLTRDEIRRGYQCGACTRRDESLYGSGVGL